MKEGQEYSPKYWAIHDKTTDDIIVETLSKSYWETVAKYNSENNKHSVENEWYFEDDDNLECILIEIKKVVL